MTESKLPGVLKEFQSDILAEWLKEQSSQGAMRPGLIRESELRAQCEEFLSLLTQAVDKGNVSDTMRPEFAPVREMIDRLMRSRAEQGFSSSETASFVLLLKRPLFARIRREFERDPSALFHEIQNATDLVDRLALLTTEAYQKGRETVIARQQAEMLELSTPVVKLWDGVLALPLIGTLDSNRTQIVMETLLQRVVETGSEIVIIDITGVPMVDTLVAQHLLKTISAARLMGVECIISGIRPQIAQTIVHLGVALGEVTTKASLADAFRLAIGKRGLTLARVNAQTA
jgi:rsbT co-antagonist protein RsbR